MSALSLLLVLDLTLVAAAGLLLLIVIIRRGSSPQYLALAVGVWYTAIRTPPELP